MPEYFLRKNDPLAPVYEVDFEAGTWRLAASRIGVVPGGCGELFDGGDEFLAAAFVRVWPRKQHADGVVTFATDVAFTTDPPAASAAPPKEPL